MLQGEINYANAVKDTKDAVYHQRMKELVIANSKEPEVLDYCKRLLLNNKPGN